jgi:hypothetical protein
MKVSAAGGVPTPATELKPGDGGHARPFFLPDGRHFLYRTTRSGNDPLGRGVRRGGASRQQAAPDGAAPIAGSGAVLVGSLDSSDRTLVLNGVSSTNVFYAQGHLLYLRETTLMAQPFDTRKLAVTGDAFPVAEQIQTLGNPAFGFFSASDSGVLVYQTGGGGAPQLVWFDRSGKTIATVRDHQRYSDLALSPDGRQAVVAIPNTAGDFDLWLVGSGPWTASASDE